VCSGTEAVWCLPGIDVRRSERLCTVYVHRGFYRQRDCGSVRDLPAGDRSLRAPDLGALIRSSNTLRADPIACWKVPYRFHNPADGKSHDEQYSTKALRPPDVNSPASTIRLPYQSTPANPRKTISRAKAVKSPTTRERRAASDTAVRILRA